MFNLFASEPKAYKNFSGKEFKEEFKASKSAVLIDVRSAGEFASGTIPGSQNIDVMSPLFSDTIEKLDKNKEYFVFCRSGNRSAHACAVMSKKGYKVANLKGGIAEWPIK